jgi:hypothetical protein
MASIQPTHVHESWAENLKGVEKGNPAIKGTRVVEALREWGSEAWVGCLSTPTDTTTLPDLVAMLWESTLNAMHSFGLKERDWQEPTALRQQLKGLEGTLCHQRLWLTLEHSPASRQVNQAVTNWFKELETKRIRWGREHRKVLSTIAKIEAAPEGILPAFLPVKDTLDRLQELSQLSISSLAAAGDPEPETDLIAKLQSVAKMASNRTVILAKQRAQEALLVEPGLDLPTILLKLIEPVEQPDNVWNWTQREIERVAQDNGTEKRTLLTSITATLVAGLLQTVSQLTAFAAEQDNALLAIQLAASAKQKKITKKEIHRVPRSMVVEGMIAGPSMEANPNTSGGPGLVAGFTENTTTETDTRTLKSHPTVRKAKRTRFDSMDISQGQRREEQSWDNVLEEEEMESAMPTGGTEKRPGRGTSRKATNRKRQRSSGNNTNSLGDGQRGGFATGPPKQHSRQAIPQQPSYPYTGYSGSESAYMQLSTMTPNITSHPFHNNNPPFHTIVTGRGTTQPRDFRSVDRINFGGWDTTIRQQRAQQESRTTHLRQDRRFPIQPGRGRTDTRGYYNARYADQGGPGPGGQEEWLRLNRSRQGNAMRQERPSRGGRTPGRGGRNLVQ